MNFLSCRSKLSNFYPVVWNKYDYYQMKLQFSTTQCNSDRILWLILKYLFSDHGIVIKFHFYPVIFIQWNAFRWSDPTSGKFEAWDQCVESGKVRFTQATSCKHICSIFSSASCFKPIRCAFLPYISLMFGSLTQKV